MLRGCGIKQAADAERRKRTGADFEDGHVPDLFCRGMLGTRSRLLASSESRVYMNAYTQTGRLMTI